MICNRSNKRSGYVVKRRLAVGTIRATDFVARAADRLRHRASIASAALLLGLRRGVIFAAEGGIVVTMPRIGLRARFIEGGAELERRMLFLERPEREVLLRSIVWKLFVDGVLPKDSAVIDIGAWLGDNSLVWSRMLDPERGVVHAVDPSTVNVAFAKRLAEASDILNVNWHIAVCSSQPGETVYYEGDLRHAKFTKFSDSAPPNHQLTQTLDGVIPARDHARVSLLHVDVEGFEHDVLAGATEILRSSRPLVIFEGHLNDSNEVRAVEQILQGFGYAVFMINEVIPGCSPDCRNFLAIGGDRASQVLEAAERLPAQIMGSYPAMLGPALISIG